MKPNVYIERNSTGQLYIGAVYFDADGTPVRNCVLAFQPDFVAESTFLRQFEDIKQLANGHGGVAA